MPAALHHTLDRVRAAVADRTPLHLCGGGSKAFFTSPMLGAEPIYTHDLTGIVSYEPSELVVTVRAGTPLADLEAALAQQGQCLAFEPPHFAQPSNRSATVGGMVAAGWSGPARASVGAVRDFVLGVEIINGQAELLRFGGTVMKNVAGYDVSRLMAGSWGTLGVLTEVSLKVLPVVPGEATLCFADVTQAQALQQLNQWGGLPLPLNASCWHEANGIGMLCVRLRGAVAAVEAACSNMGGALVEPQDAAMYWQACREQSHTWFAQRRADLALWRLSLPQTAPALQLPADVDAPLVEWHGGLRWVQAPADRGPVLHALAQSVGGNALMFRASEQASTKALQQFDAPKQAVTQRLHQQLKQAFDPMGIFNPGQRFF